MRLHRLGIWIVMVLLLGVVSVGGVRAQEAVTVTPSQLTVAGMRGTRETRTLLISASDEIAGIELIPLDLLRADGVQVFPAKAIQAKLPAERVAAGGVLTVPVTFALSGMPSGEFTGELLIRYQSGSLTLPVTVRVKDHWLPPLLVLVVGVVLGWGVSLYRSRGRPRDEILVRVGRLRAQMQADEELATEFRSRIEGHLVDGEAALDAEKWEEAQGALEQAEALWLKWRKWRGDWVDQLYYHAELSERLKDLGVDSPYARAVNRGVEDALRDAPDLEGPNKLRERLETLAQQLNRYDRLKSRLSEANRVRAKLSPDQGEAWRQKAIAWQCRFDALEPDDESGYQTLLDELEAAIAEMSALVQPVPVGVGMPIAGVGDVAMPMGHGLMTLPPSVRPWSQEGDVDAARRRLQWFRWGSYAIAVALLAGAGFGEMYVARATFGASPWGDYFGLLAWGFGAEASRAAVTEVIHGWGLK